MIENLMTRKAGVTLWDFFVCMLPPSNSRIFEIKLTGEPETNSFTVVRVLNKGSDKTF